MENSVKNQGQYLDNELNDKDDEIDLVKLAQRLWKKRIFIIKVTCVFITFSLFIAIFSPEVYVASCTMVPQTGEKKAGGNLSGLAAMAGINLGSLGGGEVLSPSVYPIILSNINFQKELIYTKIKFNNVDKPISIYEFYTNDEYQKFNLIDFIKKVTIGLPKLILHSFKGSAISTENANLRNDSIPNLSTDEVLVVNILKNNLVLSINDKGGYFTLSGYMPQAVAAAELTQRAQELLQKYISKYKIERVSYNLKFVEKSYDEAKKNFETKQEELARFRDGNKNFTSAIAKTQEEKLLAEYNLHLSIYSELAKQKEQAKIAVTENTPILSVIEPVVVPDGRVKPKRVNILISFTIIGFIFGCGFVVFKPYLTDLINSLRSSDYK